MKILVVRFRQMGDAILATPLLSTLKKNFPDADIDFVLNERIGPLFEGHPALSHIITFSEQERHSFFTYIRKVWRTVHQTRYDVIIDMRSTVNTMLFALFSLRSKWRIGIRKPYTWGTFNHRFEGCAETESMISHNLRLAEPLKEGGADAEKWTEDRNLSLAVTEQERHDFRQYMEQQGIDFARPVMLVGVTAKLEHKTWSEDRMTETLSRLIATFPSVQLIFNYAPGREAENARRIYDRLCAERQKASSPAPSQPLPVFLSIEAKSPRQLAAMAANCTAYFGNEGGARHIVHAMGRPSLVVCSPGASKTTWLPQDTDIVARGVDAPSYDLITVDRVWAELEQFCKDVL
ncbi:MAG: glycosyltransferase family 9 protein [Prevotella sp.]|nr:glycosyltransferase family 9 protein [Prevotella sp.]